MVAGVDLDSPNIGSRIREVRKSRGIAQDDLGFSRPYISKLETGYQQASIGCIEQICQRLGMDIRRFLAKQEDFDRRMMLEDGFTLEIVPHLKNLTLRQKDEIVKTLKAASGIV